jgi:hypothetical protein
MLAVLKHPQLSRSRKVVVVVVPFVKTTRRPGVVAPVVKTTRTPVAVAPVQQLVHTNVVAAAAVLPPVNTEKILHVVVVVSTAKTMRLQRVSTAKTVVGMPWGRVVDWGLTSEWLKIADRATHHRTTAIGQCKYVAHFRTKATLLLLYHLMQATVLRVVGT